MFVIRVRERLLAYLFGPVNVRNEQLQIIFGVLKRIPCMYGFVKYFVLECHKMFGYNKLHGFQYHDIAKTVVFLKF